MDHWNKFAKSSERLPAKYSFIEERMLDYLYKLVSTAAAVTNDDDDEERSNILMLSERSI